MLLMLFQYIHLHYVHCISASSRLFKTPSAAAKVVHAAADPETVRRAEDAAICADGTVRLTRVIVPADSRPIEF